jgi:hypothetical protein
MNAAAAGLQSCYACQRNSSEWASTEDAQRIYAQLAQMMFNTTLPPSPQLTAAGAEQPAAAATALTAQAAAAAVAAAAARSSNTTWLMASSPNSSTACTTCYYDLHARLLQRRVSPMTRAMVRTCVACMEAQDLYEDARLVLLSKAAAVYYKRRLQLAGSTQYGKNFPYKWDNCRHCMGWVAQQPHQLSSELDFNITLHRRTSVRLRETGKRHSCELCFKDSISDHDLEVFRTRVNYDMASLLFEVQLVPPPWLAPAQVVIQKGWKVHCDEMQSDNSTLPACAGGVNALDVMLVAQKFVLLSPKDLHNLHEFLDGQFDQSSVESHSTTRAWHRALGDRICATLLWCIPIAFAAALAAAAAYTAVVFGVLLVALLPNIPVYTRKPVPRRGSAPGIELKPLGDSTVTQPVAVLHDSKLLTVVWHWLCQTCTMTASGVARAWVCWIASMGAEVLNARQAVAASGLPGG